jgi:hypothetical protein
MLNAAGTGYEFCKVAAGRNCNWELAGYATLRTFWQVHGGAAVLNKSFKLQTTLAKWTWNTSFTLGRPSLTLSGTTAIDCSAPGAQSASCALAAPSITLPVSAGSQSANVSFTVGFNWVYPGSGPDMATFRVKLDSLNYTIQQADVPTGDGPRVLRLYGANGASFEPDIRCDRGINTGAGCVMPDAAAVLVMESTSTTSGEAAVHIRDAQTVIQAGMTSLAPGAYAPLPGTRAVAQTGGQFPFAPLFRSPGSKTANRNASCDLAGSLYNTRPFTGSTSCPTRQTTVCGCDEYPFAATSLGGGTNPGSTSVRGILKTHNSRGGSELGSFVTTERVLTDTAGVEGFYVFVK